jgi:ribonuclease HII
MNKSESSNDLILNKKEKKTRSKSISNTLKPYYDLDNFVEIGIDEVGRGPMLGRVYTAAVILPKDDTFDHSKMKDSKKFHSKAKIKEVSEYIKNNAIAWNIQWEDEKIIDEINIRNATFNAMHKAIQNIYNHNWHEKSLLLIDGNDFKPYTIILNNMIEQVPHICIEGGDNKYSSIAAASILAKVARDEYIEDLCNEYPFLQEKYDLLNNKGYGTKKHMNGIKQFGISQWHRKSFGICRNFS